MNNDVGTTYRDAGVDTERQNLALQRVVEEVRETWLISTGVGSLKLPIGYFANVIDIGGTGLAIATDGVGTKAIVAQMMDKYDTIGIDCVAMNVNDIVCVGAKPLSMVDYVAVQDANPDQMASISHGLRVGAERAGISISGGETAQLREIIKGYKEGFGFDLVGTAVGTVALDNIIVGQDLSQGDAIVGIESNGIHSNGLSLARHVLFERGHHTVDSRVPTLGQTIGAELLEPTYIYVNEALDLLSAVQVNALAHITSDGFLNLTRVDSDVSFVIDDLPEIPSIFGLIQEVGNVADEEMFRVFNMGIGFCIVVPEREVHNAITTIHAHGKTAHRIGYVRADGKGEVTIVSKSLVGKEKSFSRG